MSVGFTVFRPALEAGPYSVARPRVLEPLREGMGQASLIWLWGPPGLGKTWLARQLCAAVADSTLVLWHTTLPDDGDGTVLLGRIREALGTLIPSLRRLSSSHTGGLGHARFVTELVEACIETLRHDLLIVVDEAEGTLESDSARQALVELAEQAPPQLHLLLTTRGRETRAAAKLADQGRLLEMGPALLRWTREEVKALLEVILQRPVSWEEAEGARAWAGGVVAPIALAARSGILDAVVRQTRSSRTGVHRPSLTLTAPDVAEWALERVLKRLPPGLASFVEHVAVVPELTPSLAADLTGWPLSRVESALRELVEVWGLVEVSLETGRFRLHDLWRQATLALLVQRRGEETLRGMYASAARLLLARGEHEAAVDLMLAGRCWEDAADTVAGLVLPMIEASRHERLGRWLDALPVEAFNRHAGLFLLARGVHLRHSGRLEEAQTVLEQALSAGAPAVRCLLAQADLAGAMGHYDRCAELAQQAFARLGGEGVAMEPPASRSTAYELGRVLELSALPLWYRGQRDQASRLLRHAIAAYRQSGARLQEAFCIVMLAVTEHEVAGRLRHLLKVVREARALAGDADDGTLLYYEGATLHQLGEYEEAARYYGMALDRVRQTARLSTEALIVAKMGILAAEMRRLAEARERLLEARQLIEGLGEPMRLANVYWGLSVVYRFQGEPVRALAYAQEDRKLMQRLGFEVFVAESNLNLAYCALASGQFNEAQAWLQQAFEPLERWHSAHNLALYYLAQAALHGAIMSDDPMRDAAVDDWLARALRTCEEHGYRFLWRREAGLCRILLEGYVQRHPGDAYAREALATARAEPVIPEEQALWASVFRQSRPGATTSGMASIKLLGPFEIRVGDVQVPCSRWRAKALRLLQFLLLRWGQWVETDRLVEVFWEDSDPTLARKSLAVTVHYLRRQLRPYGLEGLVQSRKGGYRAFEPPGGPRVAVDLEELRGLLSSRPDGPTEDRQAQRVFELYRGELLQEASYEPWVEEERTLLREQVVRFAEQVAERALAAGNYSLARMAAERALLVDRLREGAHRLLMLALYAMGRRAEAVRQFRVCRRLLRRELGVTPEPETVRLVQRIVDREPVDRLMAG